MKIRSDFVTNSSSTSFIVIMDKDYSKKEFIHKLGAIENTFAAEIIGQIYATINANAGDFKKDYEKYHAKEYDSFDEYLEKNKNFQKDTIEKIKDAYKKGMTVLIGGFDSAGGDTPIESYLCLEPFKIDVDGIYIDGLSDVW